MLEKLASLRPHLQALQPIETTCSAPFETDGFLEQLGVPCPGGRPAHWETIGGPADEVHAALKSLVSGGRPFQAYAQVKFTTTRKTIPTCQRGNQVVEAEEQGRESWGVAVEKQIAPRRERQTSGEEKKEEEIYHVQVTVLGPRKIRGSNGVAAWRRRGVIPRRHLLLWGPEGAARARGTSPGRRPLTGPRRHCSAVSQRCPRGVRGRP